MNAYLKPIRVSCKSEEFDDDNHSCEVCWTGLAHPPERQTYDHPGAPAYVEDVSFKILSCTNYHVKEGRSTGYTEYYPGPREIVDLEEYFNLVLSDADSLGRIEEMLLESVPEEEDYDDA
jgi:hypothetical protein